MFSAPMRGKCGTEAGFVVAGIYNIGSRSGRVFRRRVIMLAASLVKKGDWQGLQSSDRRHCGAQKVNFVLKLGLPQNE